jgi:ubiquinone/menaquinone biosynthesis C-methylase UbiE
MRKDLLKIDIGCGLNKKPGCLGIDIQKLDGVDFVLDMTKDKLPFEDNSVDYIYMSHFLEHIKIPNNLFSEISRVAIDGAKLEIWTPYAHSDDAFCYGHEVFYAEEHWQHMCIKYPDFYIPILNARWFLDKIVYVIDEDVLNDIEENGFNIGFAIKYFKGIVREFGVFITINHKFKKEYNEVVKYYSLNRFSDLRELGRTKNDRSKVLKVSEEPSYPTSINTTTQTNVGPLLRGIKLCQKFTSLENNLSAVSLLVATYCKEIRSTARFSIYDAENNKMLRQVEIETDRFADNSWQRIDFEPIADSARKILLFCVETNGKKEAITLWTNNTVSGYCQKNGVNLEESICFYCHFKN